MSPRRGGGGWGAVPAEGETPEAGADASDPVAEFEDDGPSEDPSAGPSADGSEGTVDGSEVSDVAGVALEAQAGEASGTFHGMDWRLTSDGELILGKAGEEQALSNGNWWMYSSDWPWYASRSAIASVRVEGTVHASGSLHNMFYGCSKLVTLGLSGLDTSAVTSMSSMFYGCSSLSSLDLSGLDTSAATSMYDMFYGCSSLAEVTLGEGFSFAGAGGDRKAQLPDAVWVAASDGEVYLPSQVPDNAADTYRRSGEWKASGTCMWRVDGGALTVRPMRGGEGALADWGMGYAPWHSRRDEISSARFEGAVRAPTCYRMLYGCSSLATADLSGLDTSAATSMSSMFSGCSRLSSLDLSGLDASAATDMSYMFYGCSSLSSLDLSGLDTSAATSMYDMFYGCSSLAEVTLGEGFSFAGAGGDRKAQLPDAVWVAASDGEAYLPSQVPDNAADTYRRSGEWKASGTCMWRVDGGALTVRPVNGGGGSLANWGSGYAPWHSRRDEITSARFEGAVRARTCHGMFSGCSSLSSLDLSGLDASAATDMSSMFSGCSRLSSLDLSGLDTSAATDMSYMFYGCSGLSSLDVSGWDTSRVTSMYDMFYGCSSLSSLDLSGLDASAVTSMSYMFSGCSSLSSLDLSGLDTSAATDMYEMFSGCSSLTSLDLSGLDTSAATDMRYMFDGCSSLAEVTLGEGFSFAGAGGDRKAQLPDAVWVAASDGEAYLPSQVPDNAADTYRRSDEWSDWAISGTCMWRVDGGALTVRPVNGGGGSLANWGSGYAPWHSRRDEITSARFEGAVRAPTCHGMFSGCSRLSSLDLSGLDTSSATSMREMFSGCSRLSSLDLSGLDASAATDMSSMFSGCSRLSSLDLSGLDTSAATDMSSMFSGCSRLSSLDLSGLDTSAATYMSSMFSGCSGLSSLDLSAWDTSAVTNMYQMFYGCSSLSSLDVSGWDTSAVTNMYQMFYGCSSLASLDVSGWDTSSATSMSWMFYGCSRLSSLDVSGWDTSSVTDMDAMFSGCSSLSSLDVSDWDTYVVTNMGWMFSRCSSLVCLDLSGWDTDAVADTGGMFSGCTSLCRVRLGELCTRMGELPSPGATGGRWLSEGTGAWYAPSEIASQRLGVADTYTCSADTKPAGGFTDVDAYTPHLEDVLWLSAKGISTGYDERDGTRTFRGMVPVYRQDMAAFLYRLAGKPSYVPTQKDIARFRDVSRSTPHATEIWWLASAGISEGWDVGGAFEFRGGETVKRQDMAAFLRRLARRMGADADATGAPNPFRDVNESTAHYEDILWLASTGVTKGWDMGDGTFEYRGMSDVVRQDMAAFLHRLDSYVKGSVA